MKLELLVVLAVAALVPSLSEGLLLSKCELKPKLTEAADQFNLTEKIAAKGIELDNALAKIICSLDLKSGLNTSLVTNLVLRKPFLHKSKRRPISRRPVRRFGHKRPVRDVESKEDRVSSEGEEDKPRPTGKPGGMKPKPTGKTEGVSPRSEGPEVKRMRPGSPARGRNKREAEECAGDKEEHDKVEVQESKAAEVEEFCGYEDEGDEDEVDDDELDEENLEELEAELDEQEGEEPKERVGNRKKRHIPKQFRGPGQSRKPPPHKPKRKPFKPTKTLSFSFFGLFQLSNRLACVSSNTTRSLNLCKTECRSFVDDDIRDDIACFVKSRAWMKALKSPWKCAKLQASEYFECDQPLNSTMSTLSVTNHLTVL
ncbi:histone-lysine N-methyltransferase SETD1B-like [Oncorhynchus masou masou]|uniref:histone-lysine N-methyltransferase SETD1B-like n=1 Tax=Oncorhynchus masou masou TaxID=90313 RepID=UPI003183DAA7